jgi:hypothetical protein
MKWIAVYLLTGSLAWGGLISENFDSYRLDFVNGQGGWTNDYPGQSHQVVVGLSNKAMAVTATNGFTSVYKFSSQESGVFKCSFDFQPKRGLWTVLGFKSSGADWDRYQAAVFFGPVDDFIYVAKGTEHSKISERPLRWGDGTALAVYHVEMMIRVGAADKKAGSYRVKVTSQEGLIAQTDWMPFASDAEKPLSMFEVRSIAWSQAQDSINGLVDNLVVENDLASVPFSLSVVCDKWGQIYHKGKPVTGVLSVSNLIDKKIDVPVTVTVIDPYGKEVYQKSLSMAMGSKETTTVREGIPAGVVGQYGLYHLKLAGGSAEAKLHAQTTFAVIASPVKGNNSFESHFGVFQYPLDSERGYLDKIVEQMYDLGARWVRINLHWYCHEVEKGKFSWGAMGEFIDLAYKHDMHVMVELVNTAQWASSRAKDARVGAVDTGEFWQTVAPKDFADWENYCRQAALRFKGKVVYYEIWNEPGAPLDYKNFNGFWRDSTENYIKVIKTARKAILSVDPNAKIVVGGFRGVDLGAFFDHFVERVMPAIIADVDVVSFHSCLGSWTSKYHNFKLLTQKLGRPDMRFFDTEGPGLNHNNSSIVGSYLEDWSRGVEKSFGFIYNLPRYAEASLVKGDYTPGIGAVSFATMARFVEGATMEGPISPAAGIRAYSLLKDGKRIIVAWSEVPDKEIVGGFYAAVETYDYVGNPGPKITPDEYYFKKIPIGNNPVYIFCDLDLDLKGIVHESKQ